MAERAYPFEPLPDPEWPRAERSPPLPASEQPKGCRPWTVWSPGARTPRPRRAVPAMPASNATRGLYMVRIPDATQADGKKSDSVRLSKNLLDRTHRLTCPVIGLDQREASMPRAESAEPDARRHRY